MTDTQGQIEGGPAVNITVSAQIEASNSDLLEALAVGTAVTGIRPGQSAGLIEVEITGHHFASHEQAAHWLDTFLLVNGEEDHLVSQPSEFAKFKFVQKLYTRVGYRRQ